MEKHHLLLGYVRDYLTGERVEDTHDGRYRQKLARFLVEERGFSRSEIEAGRQVQAGAGRFRGSVTVDFVVRLEGVDCMLVKYGPGSIVTRRRGAVAASRLVAPCQVPVVVVTNGEDAEVLDGASGRVLASGFAQVPDRISLLELAARVGQKALEPEVVEKEARILYALEVEGSCNCERCV